jgi:hypothetical protein
LGWFRTISLSHVTHSENGCWGAYKHEFLPPEPFLRFSQRTCSIHYFRSKTHVWGCFAQFRCRTSPIPKTGVGVHSKHEFLPPKPFLLFSQRTCPLNYFRSKTLVWGIFAQFRCRTSPIPKNGCRGAFKARVFATRTISSFFATNMPNPLLDENITRTDMAMIMAPATKTLRNKEVDWGPSNDISNISNQASTSSNLKIYLGEDDSITRRGYDEDITAIDTTTPATPFTI